MRCVSSIRVILLGCSVFFDEGKWVVLCNGFQKKTNKTPKKEIERAIKIKKEYYNDKGKADDWF
jgi:phage-related protein